METFLKLFTVGNGARTEVVMIAAYNNPPPAWHNKQLQEDHSSATLWMPYSESWPD